MLFHFCYVVPFLKSTIGLNTCILKLSSCYCNTQYVHYFVSSEFLGLTSLSVCFVAAKAVSIKSSIHCQVNHSRVGRRTRSVTVYMKLNIPECNYEYIVK